MWKLEDIKQKQKYIKGRLDNCSDPKEKEKLGLTLITYYALLDNSGTFKYTRLHNLFDKFTNNNFSLKKDAKLAHLEIELFFKDEAYLSDEYLDFLLQLCDNVSKNEIKDLNEEALSLMKISKKSLIDLSKKFYASLQDEEILELSKKLLDDETSINFSNVARVGMKDNYGITFNDYIFDKSYITIIRQNNIFDYQALNHEIMHGIDFYMKNKVPSENYYGFHEVPTYTIDYLFIDYLEENCFDPIEVQDLRLQKDNYLSSLAIITKMQIKNQLIKKFGFKNCNNPTTKQIRNILNPQLKKQLLEIQSGVIAYGLKEQIKENRKCGLLNLKKFMKNIIPKNQTPDFTYIGLSNYELLKYSKQVGKYSMQIDSNVSIRK